jgi:CHASE2 domain-containing sensor protein
MGFLDLGYPEFWWVAAALAILAVLTVQGLGILTPVNIFVYLEMLKAKPDAEKIGRWMKIYVRVVAIQGAMQVAMIMIMVKFATGL